MQQLHLVGFTTDLEGLIFSARKGAKSGGYLVVLDDKLRATVEDALRLRNGQVPLGEDDDDGAGGPSGRPRRPKPESTLSPREIQARLRSGSTIAEVARDAGVDEEWVSRFAVPIQAEQAQVVGRARGLTFVKPRLGESALPLGTAVRWNLADKGVLFFDDDYEAAWSAYNLQGASWVVRFEYTSRQKRHAAEWEVDLREGELFARNRVASELGHIDAARRRRRPPALEPSPRETPARPVEQARAPAAQREEEAVEATPVSARPPTRRLEAVAVGRPASGGRASAAGGRGGGPVGGRSAFKKSAATSKARAASAAGKAGKTSKAVKSAKAAKAAKAGKATASRKATSTKRGRAQKPAGKKRAGADQGAPKVAPVPAARQPDAPVRPSHLARPPSPIPSARRATTLPLHARHPVPRPPAPIQPVRRPPRPEPEAIVDADLAADPRPARPAAADRPAPSAPARRAATEGVRVLGGAEPGNGEGPAAAPRRRPSHASEEPAADSPERKLARRLASAPTQASRPAPPPAARPAGTGRADGGGRTRPATPPAVGSEPEALWHGPGSGEPAPAVRIRADLAAGTRRPPEPAEPAPSPVAHSGSASARTRRRERPLRAR